MNSKWTIVFLSIAIAVVSGCGREVISVGTADELISAIGPNRTIELRPGIYDMGSVPQRQMKFVRWRKVFDGYELTVRDVADLKLIGAGEAPQLLAKSRYATVLSFDDCKGIALKNLVLGHTPEGYCTGGVVRMDKCVDVVIDKCDLFGCGIKGLELHDVARVQFSNSIIRDCTYRILSVFGSFDIVFSNSKFIRNKEFGGFSFSDSRNIRLERCVIKDNRLTALKAELFSAVSCSDIVVSGCTITGNVYKKFIEPENSIRVVDTKVEGNSAPPADAF
ncbi:MAG: right-handed parallel beta-helix repeat-containing protein [Phycisphaerae bacterium]|jgi:hypothetical protein|nr:right-handed parallel beta-helix repeat-containing protein [Phycisphaerae bacterium]